MQNFRDLKVWHKAHVVTLRLYASRKISRRSERYGLTSQMRRAAASVPANIAEGCVRSSDADFARFLSMWRWVLPASSSILPCLRETLCCCPSPATRRIVANIQEVERMLTALIARLRADS